MSIRAWVDSDGQLIYFGTYNGINTVPITKVNSNPVISVNGQVVPTSSGMYANGQVPWVAYQPLCGQVEFVGVANGGYGVTNPTFDCPGVAFGDPILAVGVTRYIIQTNGNFAANPPVSTSYGVAHAAAQSGQLAYIVPNCENILGRDQATIGSPLTTSVGVGQSCQLVATIASGNGQINSIGIYQSNNGQNYPQNPQLNIWDATGTGASGIPVVVNGQITSVRITSRGSGYTNPCFTLVPSGNTLTVQPVIESYVQYVPVISSSYFYAPPTITSSDSSIQLVPRMGGILAGDTVTYSAAANWLVASPLNIAAVSNAPVDNAVGQDEFSTPFDIPSWTGYVKPGVNLGSQPIYGFAPNCTIQNRYHQTCAIPPWNPSTTSALKFDSTGHLVSWTNPSQAFVKRWCYGPNNNQPNFTGQWYLSYDDVNVNTPMMSRASLGFSNVTTFVLNLSGPNAGTYNGIAVNPADITLANGSIKSIGTANTNLGSGYQAVLVNGSNGVQIIGIVNSGIITNFIPIIPGQGLTSKPTLTVYGIGLSGTRVSLIINDSYNANSRSRETDCSITLAQASGRFYLGNPWLTAPKPDGTAQIPADVNDVFAHDFTAVQSLSGVKIIRACDVTGGWSSYDNITDEQDLDNISETQDPWVIQATPSHNFQFARFFNTNPSNTGYAWCSNKIYGTADIFCDGEDDFGKYKILGPNDYGLVAGNGVSPNTQNVFLELRSLTPHPFKTGQIFQITSSTRKNSIPVTNAINGVVYPNNNTITAFVTGPYTLAVSMWVPSEINANAPSTIMGQTVNSTEEIDLVVSGVSPGWTIAGTVPSCKSSAPYGYQTRLCQQVGAANWVNIPATYSSGLMYQIAQQVKDSPEIYVEYNNEIWNYGNTTLGWLWACNRLYGYVPAGSSVGNYYVSNGKSLGYGNYGAAVILAADAYDYLLEYTNIDPSKFHRVFSSFYPGSNVTAQILENAAIYGIPVDKVAIAPYINFPSDPTWNNMMAPIGMTTVKPGGLSPAAQNSLIRHYLMYNQNDAIIWNGHLNVLANYQQPVTPPYTKTYQIGASGLKLPNGSYVFAYTYADAAGLETTIGASPTTTFNNVSNAWGYNVNLPVLPKWANQVNLYVQYNQNWYLYSSYVRGAYTPGQTIAITGVPTVKTAPPTVNYASGYVDKIPSLITYEGAYQTRVPQGVPNQALLNLDSYADPSYARNIKDFYKCWGYYGAESVNYYQMFGSMPNWFLTTSVSQEEGDGSNNLYAVGGYPADGQDHNDVNVSTAVYGLHELIRGFGETPVVVPTPTPTPTPTPIPTPTPPPVVQTATPAFSHAMMNYFWRNTS